MFLIKGTSCSFELNIIFTNLCCGFILLFKTVEEINLINAFRRQKFLIEIKRKKQCAHSSDFANKTS